MESEFQSKIKPIRPKTLRNFLKIYYYAYIKKGKFLEYHLSGKLLDQTRSPKIWPGIWRIRRLLGCSKATAQDYLRAVYVTKHYFVEPETNEKLIRVKSNNFDQLLEVLAKVFEDIAKILGAGKEKAPKPANLQRVRESLNKAAKQVEQVSGGFTPEDCAKILRELASWL